MNNRMNKVPNTLQFPLRLDLQRFMRREKGNGEREEEENGIKLGLKESEREGECEKVNFTSTTEKLNAERGERDIFDYDLNAGGNFFLLSFPIFFLSSLVSLLSSLFSPLLSSLTFLFPFSLFSHLSFLSSRLFPLFSSLFSLLTSLPIFAFN